MNAYHVLLPLGKPGSQVSGIVHADGQFEGKVVDVDGEYFISKAENVFNSGQEAKQNLEFHSVSLLLAPSPFFAGTKSNLYLLISGDTPLAIALTRTLHVIACRSSIAQLTLA